MKALRQVCHGWQELGVFFSGRLRSWLGRGLAPAAFQQGVFLQSHIKGELVEGWCLLPLLLPWGKRGDDLKQLRKLDEHLLPKGEERPGVLPKSQGQPRGKLEGGKGRTGTWSPTSLRSPGGCQCGDTPVPRWCQGLIREGRCSHGQSMSQRQLGCTSQLLRPHLEPCAQF